MAVGSSDYVGQSFRNRTSLVEDLLDNEGGYARGPERALIAALLFDGVQAYMNYGCTEEGRKRSRFREAFLWVHTKGSEYVFSFDNVCEALGIDAEFLRLGLANACNSQTYEWKRARRNF
jgi:hypothetical protein